MTLISAFFVLLVIAIALTRVKPEHLRLSKKPHPHWDQFSNGFVPSALISGGIACLAVISGSPETLLIPVLFGGIFLIIGMRWKFIQNRYYGIGIACGTLFVIMATFPILMLAGINF